MPRPDRRRQRARLSAIAVAAAVAIGAVLSGSPAAADAPAGPAAAGRPATPPATPPAPRVRLDATTAVLTWDAVAGARRYRLINHAGRAVWAGTRRSVRRSALRPGVGYGWRLQAVGARGIRSALSPEADLAVPPAVPGGVGATVDPSGVTLYWSPAAGAVRFRLAAADTAGRPTGSPLRATGRSTALTWLAPGSTSSWSVAAIAADGTGSAWSAPLTVTAPTATPATPVATVGAVTPAGATGPGGKVAVTLSWPAVPGAVAYRVDNHAGRQVRSTTATSTTLRGLQPGAHYRWTVASVNTAHYASPQSPAVDAITPRAADPPVVARTLTWGGRVRTFLVAQPALSTAPAPAVVLLHGMGDTAARFLASTRILQPALAAGEVVLAPEAVAGIWNDGRLDAPGAPGPDDVGFVLAAVDTLVREGVVDPDRVTVAGYSNGAGLAMRIAAADPDRVAELVSLSGALLSDGRAVLPTGPVPAVLVHGDADATQPWTGRPQLGPDLPAQLSQPATSQVWRAADGDTGPPTVTTITAPSWDPGLPTTVVQRWTGLAPLTFYRVVGGRHSWSYEPCPPATAAGCSADERTDAQAEPFDATALLVSIAATARLAP